uniref:Serpin domain-containing protein n=1 Tax=Romanomermis culicivorax TaxID=13658 RepID=A0A915IAE0_ROMCU
MDIYSSNKDRSIPKYELARFFVYVFYEYFHTYNDERLNQAGMYGIYMGDYVASQNRMENADFTAKLYKNLKPQSNFVVSPYSIQLALFMLYKAAGQNSRTAQQIMRYGFNLPNGQRVEDFGAILKNLPSKVNSTGSNTKYDPLLKVFALMLVDTKYNVSKLYRKYFEDFFAGQLQYPLLNIPIANDTVKLTEVVNKLVSKVTENMITDILRPDSLNPALRMLLFNAIYLKAPWANIYFSRSTKKPFYNANGGVNDVPMFQNTLTKLPYYENEKAQIIKLPLSRGGLELGMYFVLPRQNTSRTAAHLANLAQSTDLINYRKFSRTTVFTGFLDNSKRLHHQGFDQGFKLTLLLKIRQKTKLYFKIDPSKYIQHYVQSIYLKRVSLPEFKIDYEENLNNGLSNQGIRDIFQRGSADFSSLVSGRTMGNLFVDQFRHKSSFEHYLLFLINIFVPKTMNRTA